MVRSTGVSRSTGASLTLVRCCPAGDAAMVMSVPVPRDTTTDRTVRGSATVPSYTYSRMLGYPVGTSQ
jgi:hypothetical protein